MIISGFSLHIYFIEALGKETQLLNFSLLCRLSPSVEQVATCPRRELGGAVAVRGTPGECSHLPSSSCSGPVLWARVPGSVLACPLMSSYGDSLCPGPGAWRESRPGILPADLVLSPTSWDFTLSNKPTDVSQKDAASPKATWTVTTFITGIFKSPGCALAE